MKKFIDNLNLLKSLGLFKAFKFFRARSKFNPPKLEKSVKREIAYQLGLKKHRLQNKIFRITRYATTFAVMGILVSSFFSMPGDTFHAVKQKTEDVRAVVQPSFKEELKEIRDVQATTPPVKETTSKEKTTTPKKKSTRILTNFDEEDAEESEGSNTSGSSGSKSSGSGSSGSGSNSGPGSHHDDDDDDDHDDDENKDDDDDYWDVRF